MNRPERRSGQRGEWKGPERRSRFAPGARGQLLERSDDPVGDGPTGTLEEGTTEFTSDGGFGANIPNRFGGFRTDDDQGVSGEDDRTDRRGDDPDRVSGGTGGEGGFSTIGGGIYQDEGDVEDAPRHGDWSRHSTGTTSGARGHEGHDFPGERTWGEAQADAERADESGSGNRERPQEER